MGLNWLRRLLGHSGTLMLLAFHEYLATAPLRTGFLTGSLVELTLILAIPILFIFRRRINLKSGWVPFRQGKVN